MNRMWAEPISLVFLVIGVGLLMFALVCCASWSSKRFQAVLPGQERRWVSVMLSFLMATGFIAICCAIKQIPLKLEAITLFILVPHLIIVACGDHKFFDEANHDRPHDPHSG